MAVRPRSGSRYVVLMLSLRRSCVFDDRLVGPSDNRRLPSVVQQTAVDMSCYASPDCRQECCTNFFPSRRSNALRPNSHRVPESCSDEQSPSFVAFNRYITLRSRALRLRYSALACRAYPPISSRSGCADAGTATLPSRISRRLTSSPYMALTPLLSACTTAPSRLTPAKMPFVRE